MTDNEMHLADNDGGSEKIDKLTNSKWQHRNLSLYHKMKHASLVVPGILRETNLSWRN